MPDWMIDVLAIAVFALLCICAGGDGPRYVM